MRRIDRSPRNDVTQLKKLDGDNNRGVDRASDNQVGRKRKAAEPNAQRARQDEQRNACDRNTEKETITIPVAIAEGDVRPLAETKAMPPTALATAMTASNRSFLSSLAFMPAPALPWAPTIHGSTRQPS
jgi:hypothetical protein